MEEKKYVPTMRFYEFLTSSHLYQDYPFDKIFWCPECKRMWANIHNFAIAYSRLYKRIPKIQGKSLPDYLENISCYKCNLNNQKRGYQNEEKETDQKENQKENL